MLTASCATTPYTSSIIKYDLLKPEHVALVKHVIAAPQCVFIHFAPPCGTSSRARLIQRRGRCNPPILGTDQFPGGTPGLAGTLPSRVHAVNSLYHITCELVRCCIQHDTYFAMENLGRSFRWQTKPFVSLTKQFLLREVFPPLRQHAPEINKNLYNIPSFQQLEAFCDNNHQHEPWGQSPDGNWRTAEEIAYLWNLCRTIAAKLVEFRA